MSSPGGLWAGTLWAKQMMWKAVEGDWLILDHAGRLKFQSSLVVTGAIVNGRDDGLFGTSHPVTIQLRFLGFLANVNGAGRPLGTYSMNTYRGVGLLERSQHRLVNDGHREGTQGPNIPVVVSRRFSDLSSISCSLFNIKIFVMHNYLYYIHEYYAYVICKGLLRAGERGTAPAV